LCPNFLALKRDFLKMRNISYLQGFEEIRHSRKSLISAMPFERFI